MALIVQKYGGTSVGGIDRIKHVANHIKATVAQGHNVVVVVSAMGDQTDELLGLAHSISNRPPRRELDMLLTSGERIAMALMSIALNEIGVKAVSLTGSQSGIITDTGHGNARIANITGYRIQENLNLGAVVIVAGFQGVSQTTKEITTLGRGGSDLSAIALAGYLKADRCQLYKDVDAVYSCDPRIVSKAVKHSDLEWDTMTRMAWCGANILHPRGANLAQKFNLPIEIKSSFDLSLTGTTIKGIAEMEKFGVKAITHKEKMAILSASLKADKGTFSAINELRCQLWELGEAPQIQSQTINGSCVDLLWSVAASNVSEALKVLTPHKEGSSSIDVKECGIISIVGSGFWQNPEVAKDISRIIDEDKYLFFEIKNDIITIAVKSEKNSESLKKIISDLHEQFFESK
ncbi:MAG: aspartate kinase [Proteobacteria bacterium]|nr:aspartate kinase [Pseudomonadota bacterium]